MSHVDTALVNYIIFSFVFEPPGARLTVQRVALRLVQIALAIAHLPGSTGMERVAPQH